MRRGAVRTAKKYIVEDGEKKIKWQVEGRKNKLWYPVVEQDKKSGKQTPMIYDTEREANNKLMEIVRQIKRR